MSRSSTKEDCAGPPFESLAAFYPYYLGEHRNRMCRRLHFIGTSLVLVALAMGLMRHWKFLLLMPLFGYGFAWVGHLVFEKNRPATFKHPIYSFLSDWIMFRDILWGRIKA